MTSDQDNATQGWQEAGGRAVFKGDEFKYAVELLPILRWYEEQLVALQRPGREVALVSALSEAVKGLENIADYTNALTWKTANGLAGYAEAVLVAHRLRQALISPPGLSEEINK